MRLLHAGLLAASLALSGSASAAPARRAQPVAAPPRLLNIVRVKVTPHNAASYASLEAQIVRAYDRAKARVYWIGMQAPHDGTDVLYLNLADSREAWDQMSAAYDAAVRKHPDIVDLQQRLARLTASSTSTLTARREDVDDAPEGVDFSTMRTLRLTIVDVQPGREGAFLDAIRTAPATDGSWLVYEATQRSTYALITLTTRNRLAPKDGLALPRSLRRSKGIFTKVDTRLYAVRPAMSHLAPSGAR